MIPGRWLQRQESGPTASTFERKMRQADHQPCALQQDVETLGAALLPRGEQLLAHSNRNYGPNERRELLDLSLIHI